MGTPCNIQAFHLGIQNSGGTGLVPIICQALLSLPPGRQGDEAVLVCMQTYSHESIMATSNHNCIKFSPMQGRVQSPRNPQHLEAENNVRAPPTSHAHPREAVFLMCFIWKIPAAGVSHVCASVTSFPAL